MKTIEVTDQHRAEAERNLTSANERRALVSRLRGLASHAVAALEDLLNDPDAPAAARLRAIELVLRATALEKVPDVIGPTTPEDVAEAQRIQALWAEKDRQQTARLAEL